MIKIQNINDASYKRFGKVVKDIDLSDLIAAMEATPIQHKLRTIIFIVSSDGCKSVIISL